MHRDSSVLDWLILGAVCAFVVGGVVLGLIAAAKRRAATLSFAEQNGFTELPDCSSDDSNLFSDPDCDDIPPAGLPELMNQLSGMIPMEGSECYQVNNLLVKHEGSADWCMFDYIATFGSGKDRHDECLGVLLARLPLILPEVELQPATLLSGLEKHLGMQDIDFESVEFNKRYVVRASSQKEAFEIMNPKIIDLMLRFPVRHWHFRETFILIVIPQSFDPYDALRAMEEIREVVANFDHYVVEQYGFSPKWPPLLSPVPT